MPAAQIVSIPAVGSMGTLPSTFEKTTGALLLATGIPMAYLGDAAADNETKASSAGLAVKKIILNYNGELCTYFTSCETVGDFLDVNGFTLSEGDSVSYDESFEIFDGMLMTIYDVTVAYTSTTSPIAATLTYNPNPSMRQGQIALAVQGEEGLKEEIYKNVYYNGELLSSTLYSESVITEATNEVIDYGPPLVPVYSSSPVQTAVTLSGEEFEYTQAISMTATAYTAELQTNKLTASGSVAQVGLVAADLSVLPLGTRLYIVANDGSWEYGFAVVGDTGVKNKILDLYYDTYEECINFGARAATVYVLK